jgi:dTMP kinase
MISGAFFLVLEGLDGSGKSEISRRLCARLSESLGADRVLHTFEPHDPSAAGVYIRQVLAKEIRVAPRTLALAYALNRADHVERVIVPFLEGGVERIVVCDRYYLSSLVYQTTDGLTVDDVMWLNSAAVRPDLTMFLDASPETCYERMDSRPGNRELFEDRLAETRENYFHAIDFLNGRGETVIAVDANGGVIDVLNAVIDCLNHHAPVWLRLAPVTG